MIASDIAYALDPVLFVREVLGIEPDEWQQDLLREQWPRTILAMSRQVGKSTICAALALWTALFMPGSLILLVSPSLRQSQNLAGIFFKFHRMVKGQPALASESALRATLQNGSTVHALPGSPDTLRGFAGADLIILDEASRIDDDLIQALTPMLATKPHAKIIALSSPAGKIGFFWNRWSGGDNGWHKIKITADQCKRISPEFLAQELRELGPQKYATEYLAEFADDDFQMFSGKIIDMAFDNSVEPLWN